MPNKWDTHFLDLALQHAKLSKDPSTRVGAIIVGPERELISAGFNGFPRGIQDTPERLNDRQLKLQLVVHAEMNAALAAAKLGLRIKDCTMYIVAQDVATREIWGGPPCTRCAVALIQCGLHAVVSYPLRSVPLRWREDLELSRNILEEAKVTFREIK
jgi:dCMP deaminase